MTPCSRPLQFEVQSQFTQLTVHIEGIACGWNASSPRSFQVPSSIASTPKTQALRYADRCMCGRQCFGNPLQLQPRNAIPDGSRFGAIAAAAHTRDESSGATPTARSIWIATADSRVAGKTTFPSSPLSTNSAGGTSPGGSLLPVLLSAFPTQNSTWMPMCKRALTKYLFWAPPPRASLESLDLGAATDSDNASRRDSALSLSVY
ncbi:hypothetical protein K438DRAFT_1006836 [Mycena galopus ATCC 62051]|nr:hypothetical protein K438DRAFT_1006836 [Mycena galopus ATCC 62051]